MLTRKPGYELRLTPNKEYLHAIARTVEFTPEVTQAMLPEIRSVVARERTGRILFEYDLAFALNEEQMFAIAGEWARVFPGMRIAFVNSDPKHFPALQFATGIAAAAGHEYRHFTNRREAEVWLLSE